MRKGLPRHALIRNIVSAAQAVLPSFGLLHQYRDWEGEDHAVCGHEPSATGSVFTWFQKSRFSGHPFTLCLWSCAINLNASGLADTPAFEDVEGLLLGMRRLEEAYQLAAEGKMLDPQLAAMSREAHAILTPGILEYTPALAAASAATASRPSSSAAAHLDYYRKRGVPRTPPTRLREATADNDEEAALE